MGNKNIEALNEVCTTLIDSQKGFEKAYDVADNDFNMRREFQSRAQKRQHLIGKFQQQVRRYGGQPEAMAVGTSSVERDFSQFSSMWKEDEKAALVAIDKGEEHLAEAIENKLNEKALNAETRQLLKQAYAEAKAGDAFINRWEHRL